jgi:uncharacterized membrane protein YqhA
LARVSTGVKGLTLILPVRQNEVLRCGEAFMLKKILERGALVMVVPVITLFVSAVLLGLYGAYLAIGTGYRFFIYPEYREVTVLASEFLSVIDVYLLSMVLFIFALGLYELFIGKLNVPPWLGIESVNKLVGVVILYVAIAYVKLLVDGTNPADALLFGAATGILIAVLIQYYKARKAH